MRLAVTVKDTGCSTSPCIHKTRLPGDESAFAEHDLFDNGNDVRNYDLEDKYGGGGS